MRNKDIYRYNNTKKVKMPIDKVKIKTTKLSIKKIVDNYNNKHYGVLTLGNIKRSEIIRICLNYIRHELSNYDIIVKNLRKTDLISFKKQVNERIMNKYSYIFEGILL